MAIPGCNRMKHCHNCGSTGFHRKRYKNVCNQCLTTYIRYQIFHDDINKRCSNDDYVYRTSETMHIQSGNPIRCTVSQSTPPGTLLTTDIHGNTVPWSISHLPRTVIGVVNTIHSNGTIEVSMS